MEGDLFFAVGNSDDTSAMLSQTRAKLRHAVVGTRRAEGTKENQYI